MEAEKIDSFLDSSQISKNSSEHRRAIMTSVETFKSAVLHIRDILRGMSITGMKSMRHICLYLLSRYMTREIAGSLGIPEEFSWESLIDNVKNKEGGKQNALDLFYHREFDCLVDHFDALFESQDFTFSIKNLEFHAEILQILDRVNMYEVDSQMDILGWVYEQHLKTGSSTAGRDLGQYFTNRQICEYMTQLCQPGFKEPGFPETVLDPTMGTGGFLTSYIKFYKKNYAETPIDWSIHQNKIHGYDSDIEVASLAQMNLFMEMNGQRATNLKKHDSLYGDVEQTGYDIILANMPFGLKGLKHEKCCDRIKNLKIKGNVSEPLFLQLMMASLNHGGRCAVVVPDGMLVNNSKIHKGTREMLLRDFNLKKVIKMKGKFFTNTSIEPSILLFEKNGTPTQKIEFWEVTENGSSELVEKMILSLPREELNSDFSFDVRKYQPTKQILPDIYPTVQLHKICQDKNGETLSRDGRIEDGAFPIMGGGMTYIGRHSNYNRDGFNITISKSGSSSGFVKFHEGKFWAGDCFTISPKNEELSIKYLYYFLKFNERTITMANLTGSTIPHCKWSDIKDFLISVPPRSIQDEIVATLDRFYQPGTEIADTLKLTNRAMDLVLMKPDGSTLEPIIKIQRFIKNLTEERELLKSQIIDILNSIKYYGFEERHLGDLLETFKTGKNQNDLEPGEYPFYMSNGISQFANTYQFEGEYVLTGRCGSLNGSQYYVNGKFSASDFTYVLKPKEELSAKYLYYYLQSVDWTKWQTGTTMKGIRKEVIKSYNFPFPPRDFQSEIVSILEDLENEQKNLANLIEKSKNNAQLILKPFFSQNVVQSQEIVEDIISQAPTPNAPAPPADASPHRSRRPRINVVN